MQREKKITSILSKLSLKASARGMSYNLMWQTRYTRSCHESSEERCDEDNDKGQVNQEGKSEVPALTLKVILNT